MRWWRGKARIFPPKRRGQERISIKNNVSGDKAKSERRYPNLSSKRYYQARTEGAKGKRRKKNFKFMTSKTPSKNTGLMENHSGTNKKQRSIVDDLYKRVEKFPN